MSDAARQLGVSSPSIIYRIKSPSTQYKNYFYKEEPKYNNQVPQNECAVVIKGIEYASIQEAAEKNNVSRSNIIVWIKNDSKKYADCYFKHEQLKPKRLNSHKKRKIIVDGKEYESVDEASKELGLTSSALILRLRSNDSKYSNYKYKEEVKKKVGMTRPVIINEVEYFTILDAAEALGVSQNTIRNRIDSLKPQFEGYRYKNDEKKSKVIKPAKKVIIDEIEYPSAKIAAEQTGVSESQIRKRIRLQHEHCYYVETE